MTLQNTTARSTASLFYWHCYRLGDNTGREPGPPSLPDDLQCCEPGDSWTAPFPSIHFNSYVNIALTHGRWFLISPEADAGDTASCGKKKKKDGIKGRFWHDKHLILRLLSNYPWEFYFFVPLLSTRSSHTRLAALLFYLK